MIGATLADITFNLECYSLKKELSGKLSACAGYTIFHMNIECTDVMVTEIRVMELTNLSVYQLPRRKVTRCAV